MRTLSLEELLEAGCHFGHQVNRRNPKADEFIFEARSNVHIINLEKTRDGLEAAAKFLKDLSSKGGFLVVVGTKRQAGGMVNEEIERAKKEGVTGLFYVTTRWVGGMLTNFEEVSKNYKKLNDLEIFLHSQKKEDYTKHEILLFEREKKKLEKLYGGVARLERIPDAVYLIDTHHEQTALLEAHKLDVATVGIVDTNADPTIIDYPIPANDDAVGSIKLITSYLIDAWIEGQKKDGEKKKEEKKEEKEEDAKVTKRKKKVKEKKEE